MKKVTTSAASQNFSSITKLVDKEGEVTLTKHGRGKYVLMTMEKYEGREKFDIEMKTKAEKGFWIKSDEDLWHVKIDEGIATIVKVEFYEDELDYYKVITIPENSVTFVEPMTLHIERKGKLTIEAREAGYEDDDVEDYVNNLIREIDPIQGQVRGFKEAVI